MKYIFVLFLILLGIGIYLNRTYAVFFDPIKQANLKSPFQKKEYVVGAGVDHLKYAALGDSLSAGVGSQDYHQTLPYVVAEDISQKTGKSVDMMILAQPGARVDNLVTSQLTPAILAKPDVITLLIGINDIHDFVPKEAFEKRLQDVITGLTENTTSRIIIFTIPLLGSEKTLIFPYNIFYDHQTTQYNEVIKKLALKNNLELKDLYKLTKNSFKSRDDVYSLDKFHPSEKGYLLWKDINNANFYK